MLQRLKIRIVSSRLFFFFMPVIKSAKKRVKQQKVRTDRNRHFKSRMMTLFKNLIKWVKGGEIAKAESFLDETQKAIDTAAKKNIIHKNTANRRKSGVIKAIMNAKKKEGEVSDASLEKKPAQKEKAVKVDKKKKSPAKKSSNPKKKTS